MPDDVINLCGMLYKSNLLSSVRAFSILGTISVNSSNPFLREE
jgi:hypothetical protein